MRTFWTLLSKPFVEWYNDVKCKRMKDVFGLILTISLVAVILYAYFSIGIASINAYMDVMVGGVHDVAARSYEAITLLYGAIIVLGILSATRGLSLRLFESSDTRIFLSLPVSSMAIFASQLVLVYLSELGKTFVYVMSISAMFAIITHQGTAFVLSSVVTSLLIPFLTIAVASFLAFPYYYLKKVLGGKHILMLIIVTLFVGLVFYGYSYIIDLFGNLIAKGELRFFFSEATMNKIAAITANLYPANFYARFNMGIDRLTNFLIILGLGIGAEALGFFISSRLFMVTVQGKIGGKGQINKYLNTTAYTAPSFMALLNKEFVTVLRTPAYSFQYLSTAIIMPLMVVLSMRIGDTFVEKIVGTDCNFELAIFSVLIFGMLTNTFAASNISRDGSSFWLMKTTPLSPKVYLLSKVMFCFIISGISVLISVIALVAMGLITALQGLFIFVAGLAFMFGEICFATKCDLMYPRFIGDDVDEMQESSSSQSLIIITGIISALLVGGTLVLLKVWSSLGNKTLGAWISYLIVSLSGLLSVGIGLLVFFFRIDKHYERLTEGDV